MYSNDNWSSYCDTNFKATPQEILINVDLLGSTPIYLKYLNSWKKCIIQGSNEQVVRQSIRRYERFWLILLNQLLNTNNDKHDSYELEPPPDVHWIWMLHLLQTDNYISYCIQRFGRILPHRFCRTESEQAVCRSRAAHAWQKNFPTEPFYLESKENHDKHDKIDKDVISTSSWSVNATRLNHLLDSAKKEKEFIYRIDMPHFCDQTFQFNANFRYREFLALKRLYPQWVPMYLPADIELMWRVHRTQPIQYLDDINRIFNSRKVINNFSGKDYNDNSKLLQTFDMHMTYNTFSYEQNSQMQLAIMSENQFWSLNYPNDENSFFVDGTIPRSSAFFEETKSNQSKLSTLKNAVQNSQQSEKLLLKHFPCEEFETLAVENCELIFNNVCVEELWTKPKMFKLKAYLLGANSFQQQLIFEAKGHIGHIVSETDKKLKTSKTEPSHLGKCKFDSRENRGIELQVFAGHGFGCFMKYRPISNKIFHPLQNLSLDRYASTQDLTCDRTNNDYLQLKQKMVLPKVTYTDPKITLSYTAEIANRKPFQFTLDRNPGEVMELPAYLDIYLHHVSVWQQAKADTEEGQEFFVARHSLKCKEAFLAFGVEVIRNDIYNLCAVLLFHNNSQLVALAYTIDSGYLPNSTQVLETCPLTYDPQLGEKVMMVQKSTGEDLVVIARMVEGCNGNGRVIFKTYNSKTKHMKIIEIQEDEIQSFSNDHVSVDLPTGKITITSHAENVPENIVWAFCVGCLYISSQKSSNCNTSMSSSHSILGLNSSSMSKINAGGSVKSSSGRVSLSDGTATDESSSGKKTRKRISLQQQRQNRKQIRKRKMSLSFTFLLACGFRIETSVNNTVFSNNNNNNYGSCSSGRHDRCNSRSNLDLTKDICTLSSNLNQCCLKTTNETNANDLVRDSAYNSVFSLNNNVNGTDVATRNDNLSKIPLRICQSYNPSSNYNGRPSTYYERVIFEKL
ncbi:hypothetical protein HELRODRAFT_191424 [Helobdella robusta]|uniref:Uncharacterized protein n=1 Tax=Helobdella robusta TaxID=6412 RepID=T1FSZ1_HELRO|nr:hypothetical protein HELRODRAFT_191424 [Helobdella robusta]ESO05251.1 hypothetical protein HELRODRAFT_191424 [Helobdella robusta]